MQKKECKFSKDELHQLYIEENRTLREMCPILGVKSPITARKILQSYGISTNHNERVSLQTRKGMTDDEFKQFLYNQYVQKNKSIHLIASDLKISDSALKRYFVKYKIPLHNIAISPLFHVPLKMRKNMNDAQFKNFLIDEYENKQISLRQIANELDTSYTCLCSYFIKYSIPLRETAFAKSIATQKERHPRWQGGKHVCNNGYIEVYCPEHPRAKSRKYVYEHILVMEKHLGRYLTPNEVVHHINEIKTDNRLENLQLMTNSDHIALHGYKSKGKPKDILHGAWSKNFTCCTNCGTISIKHKGNGLCVNCYATMLRHKKRR